MNAWVIKIGGSLYNSEQLSQWLTAINECPYKQLIIVPGGGPFADQVRHTDEKFGLKAFHSHNMAVMAMQQYGTLLASLAPDLILANSKDNIHQAWANKKAVIWEPYELIRDECMLEKSWQVTSDSLSLWLANYLGVRNVLLVKSSEKVVDNASIATLTKSKCIDENVQKLSELYQLDIRFLHKSNFKKLHELVCPN